MNSPNAKPSASKKPKDASPERSRLRAAQILAGLVDEQDSMLDLARKFNARMARVREVRDALQSHKADLAWFRENEAEILDSLRSRILVHLLADNDRRFSPIDYAVMLDKARLLRGESTINLSGLLGIIKQAEQIEIERVKNLSGTAQDLGNPESRGLGGEPEATPPPTKFRAIDRLGGEVEEKGGVE